MAAYFSIPKIEFKRELPLLFHGETISFKLRDCGCVAWGDDAIGTLQLPLKTRIDLFSENVLRTSRFG